MHTTFNFLGSARTVQAVLDVDPTEGHEAVTTVAHRGVARSVFWADSKTADAVFQGPHLTFSEERTTQRTIIHVYDETDVSSGEHHGKVVKFMSRSAPEAFVWSAFEQELGGENDIDAFIAGLTVLPRPSGIPGVTLSRPLAPGDFRDAIHRDMVSYYWRGGDENLSAVRFVKADALAADQVRRDIGVALVSVASPTGIVVMRDSPDSAAIDDVKASARRMAATVRVD
jgi:hypothetical protein